MKELDVDLLPEGVHTDAFGNTNINDVDKMKQLVESYDPAIHKAAVILGHSSDDAFMRGDVPSDKLPAYGWLQELSVKGNELVGRIEFDDDATDWIERKLYDYRSIGIYGADNPYNPTPGQPYVRHIALLGAQPPAIKGLTPLSEILAETYSEGGLEVMTTAAQADEEKVVAGTLATDEEDMEKEANGEGKKVIANQEEDEGQLADETEQVSAVETDEEGSADPDVEGAVEVEEGEATPEQVGAFLDESAGEFHRFILQDGPNGYKGEITRFEPEPTSENDYGMVEPGMIKGVFVDESLGEPEMFDYEIKKVGEGKYEASYSPVGSEASEEVDATANDQEVTEESVEEAVEEAVDESAPTEGPDLDAEEEEEVEASGEGKKNKVSAFSERLMQENQALRARLDAIESANLAEFVDNIYAEGQLVEGLIPKAKVVMFSEALRKNKQQVVAYSEGEELSLIDAFKEMLSNLPKVVAFGEALTTEKPVVTTSHNEPVAPPGAVFSEEGLGQLREIQAYCESQGLNYNKPADFKKAARAIAAQNG